MSPSLVFSFQFTPWFLPFVSIDSLALTFDVGLVLCWLMSRKSKIENKHRRRNMWEKSKISQAERSNNFSTSRRRKRRNSLSFVVNRSSQSVCFLFLFSPLNDASLKWRSMSKFDDRCAHLSGSMINNMWLYLCLSLSICISNQSFAQLDDI